MLAKDQRINLTFTFLFWRDYNRPSCPAACRSAVRDTDVKAKYMMLYACVNNGPNTNDWKRRKPLRLQNNSKPQHLRNVDDHCWHCEYGIVVLGYV